LCPHSTANPTKRFQAGFEPPKGLEKGFFQAVGVTGPVISVLPSPSVCFARSREAGKTAGPPEGQSPYGNLQSKFGSRPKAGIRPLAF